MSIAVCLSPEQYRRRDLHASASASASAVAPLSSSAEGRRRLVILEHDIECHSGALLQSTPAVTLLPVSKQASADLIFSERKLEPHEFAVVQPGQVIYRIPHVSQLLLKKPLAEILQDSDVGVPTWTYPDMREALQQQSASQHGQEFFIIKPNGLSAGRGVVLRQGMAGVLEYLDRQEAGEEFVVQPYLADPLLCEGRKCDLRIYVVIVQFAAGSGGAMRSFMLRGGYGRVASEQYAHPTTENMHRSRMHLANELISPDRPMDELVRRFEQLVSPGQLEPLLRRVATLCGTVVEALGRAVRAQPPLPLHPQAGSFQLVGFDVFVDADCQTVRLLEVNSKPCMGCGLNQLLLELNLEATTIAVELGATACEPEEALDAVVNKYAHAIVEV
jgi:glutathione synthase/RimK-type ligase-like ATP-grasp enzyme